MNDAEGYIYFDGPEPEPLRSLLDDVRDLPPLTREEKALMERRLFDAIDAQLGYAREPYDEVPSAQACSVTLPPVVRQPANLASTAPAAVPDGTRTPSVPPSKSGTPAHGPALKTQELPVYVEKNGMKETAPLGDNRFAIALSAIPFAGNTVGTATVHIPPMSLAQFAEFQAELAFWPTYPDWVRSRHQVPHEAAHRALNEHWQKHFADHPEDWPAYARAFAECTERLQGPGSRR